MIFEQRRHRALQIGGRECALDQKLHVHTRFPKAIHRAKDGAQALGFAQVPEHSRQQRSRTEAKLGAESQRVHRRRQSRRRHKEMRDFDDARSGMVRAYDAGGGRIVNNDRCARRSPGA